MERLRAIPAGFADQPLEEIDSRLAAIETSQQVRVIWAIESGSRAWGFPSPDSDYDCRFLFVRREGDYLSPWSRRDVIEQPIEDDIDLNGWDLGKALKLLLKGNAVILEWLMSPIIYSGNARLRDDLRHLARRYTDRAAIARHYLHLGERQRRTYFRDDEPFPIKKLFYALRPAAALRWMRLHPDATVPPMDLPTLLAESDLSAVLRAMVDQLIRDKAHTRELGSAPLPAVIGEFIAEEFETARAAVPDAPFRLRPDAKEEAEALFRSAIRRCWRETPSTSAGADGIQPQ